MAVIILVFCNSSSYLVESSGLTRSLTSHSIALYSCETHRPWKYHICSWHQIPESTECFRKTPRFLMFLDIWTDLSLLSRVLFLPGKIFQNFYSYARVFHWKTNLSENNFKLLTVQNIRGLCKLFFLEIDSQFSP